MRDDVSWKAAVAVALAAVACTSKAGPNDEAITAYLERHGITDVAVGTLLDGGAPTAAQSARRVAITVERASGLPDLDTGPGETDPYVELEYEGQRQRTSVVEGSLAPTWGDTFIFDTRPGGVLMVKLLDEDSLSSDEQVGTVSQVMPELAVGETRTLELAFRNGQGGALTLTLTGMVRP